MRPACDSRRSMPARRPSLKVRSVFKIHYIILYYTIQNVQHYISVLYYTKCITLYYILHSYYITVSFQNFMFVFAA